MLWSLIHENGGDNEVLRFPFRQRKIDAYKKMFFYFWCSAYVLSYWDPLDLIFQKLHGEKIGIIHTKTKFHTSAVNFVAWKAELTNADGVLHIIHCIVPPSFQKK